MASAPTIRSRSEWGARPPRYAYHLVPIEQRTAFMAHYANTEEAGVTDFTQVLRSVQKFHQDYRGWNDIAYNFLVDRFGVIWEGRGWAPAGGHCTGMNTPYLGVCYLGDDDAGVADLTPQAQDAFAWLYREANRRAGKTLTPMGHRDGPQDSTECPGDEIYTKVVKTRFAYANPLAGAPAPNPAPTPAPRPGTRSVPPPGPRHPFPLPAGYFFGLDDGSKYSVSGAFRRTFKGMDASYWVREFAVQLGRRGWDTGKGHKWLGRYGNDGEIGPEYVALIRAFQGNRGLAADGQIGPKTWHAAFNAPVTND